MGASAAASRALGTTDQSARVLSALAYAGFISIGLPDGLLGVAWPSIHVSFGRSVDALGTLLLAYTAGYLGASFASGRLLGRTGVGSLLAMSCLATAASLVGYAVAPRWGLMVGLATVAGLGAGVIDAGLNTYAATRLGARALNGLHAAYGLGATAGPVLMSGVLHAGQSWRWGYGIVGGLQAALAIAFALTRASWAPGPSRPGAGAPEVGSVSPASRTLRLAVVHLSVAVFFVYTGIEAAVGAWSYSLLTMSRGIPVATAGAWVSLYWASFTAGRLLSAVAWRFAPSPPMLRACLIGMASGAAMIWFDRAGALGPSGLVVMGLSSAPIFPSLIAATPERVGTVHTANAIGFQIAAAALGQSLLPGGMGGLADRFGLEIIGPATFFAVLALLGLHEALAAAGRTR